MSRRLIVCGLMFALGAAAVLPPRAALAAQGKKGNPNQMQQMQQQMQLAAQQNAALQQQVATLQAQLKKEKTDDKADKKAADKADKKSSSSLTSVQSAGLVHVVVFKVKADTDSAETQALIDGMEPLRKIKSVRALWVGKPSDGGTPDIAAKDYTVALTVLFDNPAGLKQYLDDPAHKKFADKHLKMWETPVVYDYEPNKKVAP